MGNRLFVGNLSYQATEADLRAAFAENGRTVRQVKVALDRDTGRPRGFAFVEMSTEQEAQTAMTELKGRLVAGRPISVEIAQDRPPGPRGPRPGGPGGFGGGGHGGGGPGGGGFGGPRPGGFGPRPGGFGGGYRGRMEPPPPQDFSRGEQRRRKEKPQKGGEGKGRGGRPEERERGKGWRYDPNDDY